MLHRSDSLRAIIKIKSRKVKQPKDSNFFSDYLDDSLEDRHEKLLAILYQYTYATEKVDF